MIRHMMMMMMMSRANSGSLASHRHSRNSFLSRGSAQSQTSIQRIPERVICAIFASKTVHASVGLCFINCSTGQVRLSGILDSQTYVRTIHKVNIFEPTEIVVPQSYLMPCFNKLATILQSNVAADVKIVGSDKRCFSSADGMNDLNRLAFDRDRSYLESVLSDQSYVLGAFAAAVQHMRKIKPSMNNLSFEKLRIKFEPAESTMFIDSSTVQSLQLTCNSVDTDGITLFKFMNDTVTKMGGRILRNNILQPLSDKSSIFERQQAVKELMANDGLLESIRSELKNCQDLDKLFSLMLLTKNQDLNFVNDQRINQVLLAKQAIEISLDIGELLKSFSCSLLNQIQLICHDDDMFKVRDLINEYINEDCSWASGPLDLKNQKCYAVKSGKNGLLDVSRQLYKTVVDEVLDIISSMAAEYELELEQSYNSKRGFFIKMMNHRNLESPIPEEFINRTEKRKYMECTTLDIIKCNSRLDDTVNEILTISNQIIESVVDEVSTYLPSLFMVAEALSLLDLIQSFAHLSIKNNYACPEFNENNHELRSSRHPIVETILQNRYIPNNIISIGSVSRFQVLTGTNMSGKSVYLKQIALSSIIAQMGCFIPAESANLKIFDCLKARLCVDLGLVSKGSSFANEMKEMVCILEEVNDKTLVIIDEMGGGSSINDGYAISLAICEHLIETKATVFISTHFHKLSTVLGTKVGVMQNHMKTQINKNDSSDFKMEYKLVNGVSDSRRYCITLASKFFDKEIIGRAKEISNCLEYSEKIRKLGETKLLNNKRFHDLVGILRYVYENDSVTQELLVKLQQNTVNDT